MAISLPYFSIPRVGWVGQDDKVHLPTSPKVSKENINNNIRMDIEGEKTRAAKILPRHEFNKGNGFDKRCWQEYL